MNNSSLKKTNILWFPGNMYFSCKLKSLIKVSIVEFMQRKSFVILYEHESLLLGILFSLPFFYENVYEIIFDAT